MESLQFQNETKLCENCMTRIDASKFDVHEAYCVRHIARCPQCGELVEKVALDEHMSNEHRPASCPYCRLGIEKSMLESHINICPKKPVKCSSCSTEIPADELGAHQRQCPNARRQCPHCSALFPPTDLENHVRNCPRKKPEPASFAMPQPASLQSPGLQQSRYGTELAGKKEHPPIPPQPSVARSYVQAPISQSKPVQSQPIMTKSTRPELPKHLKASQVPKESQKSVQSTQDLKQDEMLAKALQEEMDEELARQLVNNPENTNEDREMAARLAAENDRLEEDRQLQQRLWEEEQRQAQQNQQMPQAQQYQYAADQYSNPQGFQSSFMSEFYPQPQGNPRGNPFGATQIQGSYQGQPIPGMMPFMQSLFPQAQAQQYQYDPTQGQQPMQRIQEPGRMQQPGRMATQSREQPAQQPPEDDPELQRAIQESLQDKTGQNRWSHF